VEQFPRNAYAEHGVNSSKHSSAWFLTGDSQGSEMSISGIRVLGGCEAWETFIEPSRFLDHCTTEFGAGLKQDSVGELTVAHRTFAYSWPRLTPHVTVTQGVTFADCRSDTAMITNSSSCANVGLNTEFRRGSQSSVVFRLWDEFDPESILADNIVRCNAAVEPGTALVDGQNMTFSQFTYAASDYNEATSSASSIPLDPVAAIMQSDLRWLRQSVALKTAVVRTGPSREEALAAGMWDGIMAMSVSLWLEASRPVSQIGIVKLSATGIHRDDATLSALVVLLGIWFVGSLTATITLLRATWTSTLDGYATARMLQHRPVMTSTPELWFAELEQNEELLEPFKRPQWRSEET